MVGASDGKFVLPLAAAGYRVVAIERDVVALHGGDVHLPGDSQAHALGLIDRLKLEELHARVEVVEDDFLDGEPLGLQCDAVWTSCSWHYSANHHRPLGEFIDRMQRLVRPGGMFGAEFMIFENDSLDGGAWLRLRDEGTRSTLTLKQVTDGTTIDGTKEIETEVTGLHAMADVLRRVGLSEVRYQENYREEWRLGEVAFDFDTWPDLPTFLEIEGPDEASVRQAAALLDLDYSEARFGSVDEIYKSESNRDILSEPTLLFSETEKQKEAFPTAQDR